MQTMSFKVHDDDARLIRSLAKQARTSLSEYLRCRATGMTQPPAVPQRVKCPFTGAMIFSPSAGQVPLTTAAVREMLAEFP